MTEHPWFFESWHSLERIAVVGALAYLTLVIVLRLTGHKSLTKMNVFDFVFVVALGDVLASGLMDKEATYTETVAGLAVLLALRIVLQFAAKKSDSFERLLNGAALLLYRRGEFMEGAMRREDVTREEILAAMRQENIYSLDDVEAVVLETDGAFSVIKKKQEGVPPGKSTLADVEGAEEHDTPEGEELRHEGGGTLVAGHAMLVFAAGLSLMGACSPQSARYVEEKSPAYPRDSIETRSHLLGVVQGFYEPESARYDGDQDVWFVSNVLGEGSAKDGAGYIVKMDAADYTKSVIFAESGKNGVHLDAPKGMAIQGDTLWVTDIDVLRGFDRHTGMPVANIDLKPFHAVLLNDVGAGPDGNIYISDSGILMTKDGVVRVGGDKIFQVAPGRKVSIVASGDTLGRPNGVAFSPKTKQWMVVTFSPYDSQLFVLRPNAPRTTVAKGTGEWDGLEMLADGRALVTSWRDSSVHLIAGKSDERVIRGVSTPADLGVDTRRGVIAVPQINSGRVEFWTLPRD
jgi:uncharacterized membrane protein YcaP (DUF421 family)